MTGTPTSTQTQTQTPAATSSSAPPKDLREGLSTPKPKPINKPPQFFEFGDEPPTETTEAGSRTWLVRSQAMIVAYTEGVAGDTFARADQPDEYVVLNLRTQVECAAGEQRERADAPAFIVMPPGDSSVTLGTDGAFVRLFTTASADLCRRCANDATYDEPDPYVAPFAHWPDPVGGFRVRVYDLGQHARDRNRLGRLFRCTTFMVNAFHEFESPRPHDRMSPHHHDDFEQVSLCLAGDFTHHIRSVWTTNLDEWMPDEHRRVASPSVTVIPPPTIHGSQWHDPMSHMFDVFAPPRHDFSSKEGWVLNADDYPMPA